MLRLMHPAANLRAAGSPIPRAEPTSPGTDSACSSAGCCCRCCLLPAEPEVAGGGCTEAGTDEQHAGAVHRVFPAGPERDARRGGWSFIVACLVSCPGSGNLMCGCLCGGAVSCFQELLSTACSYTTLCQTPLTEGHNCAQMTLSTHCLLLVCPLLLLLLLLLSPGRHSLRPQAEQHHT